jgi:hypothetical protein
MQIVNIALIDTDTIDTVTATLTLPEVVFLALLIGRMNPIQENEVMPGGAAAGNGIYDGLATVLNRFYEDGAADALRSLAGAS